MSSVFDSGGFVGETKIYSNVSSFGQNTYITPGTYTWIAPDRVTVVSAVCIGGGGGGSTTNGAGGAGGGGGGLGIKNNISVVPGSSYTVTVGAGGSGGNPTGANGGNSFFVNSSTVAGIGGIGARSGTVGGAGGTWVGDSGGNGGAGGNATTASAGGGGGAGGYAGNGGTGGSTGSGGTAGAVGGAAGGGAAGGNDDAAGAGGGVDVLGQGSSGAGGVYTSGNGGSGAGGSNGKGGEASPGSTLNPSNGGNYGGGGGGAEFTGENGSGGSGAVRIIWGSGRSYPSTAVSNNETIVIESSGVFNIKQVYNTLAPRPIVYASGLIYRYYTQSTVTNPTAEAYLTSLFTTGTPGVVFGGSGIHSTNINWADVATTGAGGATGTKPAYLPANQFSWVVEGYILAPETGTYFFGCDGDDAMDVFVNNVNVANFYGGHGFAASWTAGVGQVSGSISLTAGQYYTFRARMQDGGGGDGLQVGWRKPSDGVIALIPSSAFFRST